MAKKTVMAKKLMRIPNGLVAIFLLIAGLQPAFAAGADRIGAWTGGHTRVVWLQDHGNGSDTLATGKNLMLYGLDSRDGRGERPLLPEKSNYFRPILTPDGKQVIVSNRLTRQMQLVDWDTGKVVALGDGVAVAVWNDPKPSRFLGRITTWVYCFVGLEPENKYGTSQSLYRFPLDNPKKKELIWNKSNLAWDNIQLSRDGQVLGGLFPWPDGGVLWTRDKRWQRLGKGCWTSLSPDNSKLLWIFDGLHRNVQVYDVAAGKDWQVNINGAPGIGGFEVYHPRWSNHPRYFVITGPYEKGEGGNRIGGGGEKVEIHIGRFDEGAKKVEDWLKVTDNDRADFYPDLWIEGGETAQLVEALSSQNSGDGAGLTTSWPAGRENLVFVWENMKAANQLDEKSPVGFFQCNIQLRGRALFSRDLQLNTAGGFGETGEAAKKIFTALSRSGQASIEVMLHTAGGQRGSILAFTGSGKSRFELYQDGAALQARSATSGATASWPGFPAAGKPLHLTANISGQDLEVFADGVSLGKKALPFDFSGNACDNVILGDEKGALQARLSNFAVYNRLLTPAEIAVNSRLAHQQQGKTPAVARLVVEATLQDTTEIPSPEAIGAYQRALVVNTYTVSKVVKGTYSDSRILVAEWAILDRKIIKSYQTPALPEQLVLEKFADNPQLEGERQMMDVFEPDLEMYYRLPEAL
ncbi:MAG: LamG domain-containing protein [Desulforhopalus sp.]|nr:LamG domain-containing protein [Desulforhopalus sp.]